MARKLIDILRERGQFQDEGEPTVDYGGLGTDDVTEAVEASLEPNNYSPRRPGPDDFGSDAEGQSIIQALKQAAENDTSLREVLDGIADMDDLLFKELSKPYIGTAFSQGFEHNRYGPTGIGRQRSDNPTTADREKLQFSTDEGVRKESMRSASSRYVREQVNNPPGGASSNQFTEGILSNNSNDGVNEVLDFYGQNERTRPSIGTNHNNEFSDQRRSLESGANLSKAMDTPSRDSFLQSAIKDNRFKPTGFNGLTPETYLGNAEYSATGQVPKPYSEEDLPFEEAELLSTDQSNRKYYISPRSVNGEEGGLAKVGDARIDQINEDDRLVTKIGSERTIEELQYNLTQGDEMRKSIFQAGTEFGDKIVTSSDEIRNLRYFKLEEEIDVNYFRSLEQETGQFIDKNTPGLRELSLSHLVYEMSKFHRGGPIQENDPRGGFNSVGEGIVGGLRQAGNRVLQEARGELERLTGRSKEIARALMAPRGSSLRETLKTTEFTSGAFGLNSAAKGEQSQDSTDAIRARLRDTDNAMRRLFSAERDDEPFSTLKERYKEGFLIAGNFERSYKEYENDFIGLAEDVQTVRDFFLKEGVERFYLSRNQVLISPVNNAKGRGMELFGIPQEKITRQQLSNAPNTIGNILGADGERIINRVVETAGPIVSAARRSVGDSSRNLILGKSPNQNLLGDSNSLKFMHSAYRSDRQNSRFYASYLRRDENDNPSMVNVLAEQLGRSQNLGVSKLPTSTLINFSLYEQEAAIASDVDIDESPEDPDSSSRGRFVRRLGNDVGEAARELRGEIESVVGRIANIQTLSSGELRDEIANGVSQAFNDEGQLTKVGQSFRVNPETVKALEDALEVQYVPFYFQDLRTNEILSFHAFLEDLRDTFNPSYDTKKFIGRVDPVVMYSGHTDRQITVSFLAFATSPDDFQYLYEKINRFIGFVYPQFNRGEEYRAEIGRGNNLRFRFANGTRGRAYIPFSQKQKAGPLVRMRVGDIIKSRAYDDSPGNVPRLTRRSEEFLGIKDVNAIVNRNNENEVERLIEEADNVSQEDAVADLEDRIRQRLADEGFESINGDSVENIDFFSDDGELLIPENFAEGSVSSVGVEGEVIEASYRTSEQQQFVNSLAEIDAIINDEIARSQASFAEQAIRINEFNATIAAINRGNDAIRRSFNEVGGRGLAGAISNLQIALLDEFPWETQPGLRAPMGFKISFSFQAIHDVAPGLDAAGEMRPVYAPKIQDGPLSTTSNPIAPSFDPSVLPSITGNSDLSSRAAEPPRPRGTPRANSGNGVAFGNITNVVPYIPSSQTVGDLSRETGRDVSPFTNTRRGFRFTAVVRWADPEYEYSVDRSEGGRWQNSNALGGDYGFAITSLGSWEDVGGDFVSQEIVGTILIPPLIGDQALDRGFAPQIGDRVAVVIRREDDPLRGLGSNANAIDNIRNNDDFDSI